VAPPLRALRPRPRLHRRQRHLPRLRARVRRGPDAGRVHRVPHLCRDRGVGAADAGRGQHRGRVHAGGAGDGNGDVCAGAVVGACCWRVLFSQNWYSTRTARLTWLLQVLLLAGFWRKQKDGGMRDGTLECGLRLTIWFLQMGILAAADLGTVLPCESTLESLS